MVYNNPMSWSVYLTRKAHKQSMKLPNKIQDLADLALVDLAEQGINPQGWNTLKTNDEYRLRLNYRYTNALPGYTRTDC